MKLVTRPRLLILAVVVAAVGVGVWLDRRDAPTREGQVVIDEAFLHRLETDDPQTTRDPAIKAVLDWYQSAVVRDQLMDGTMIVGVRRLGRESVEVTLREGLGGHNESTRVTEYVHHRLALWEFFSPRSWKDASQPRAYWEERSGSFSFKAHKY